jgi:hypothetical protein
VYLSGEIKYGVQNGSICSPVLRSNVNDLLNIQYAKVLVFLILRNEKIFKHKINMVMGELQSWFLTNNFMVCTEEKMVVSFHKRQNRNLLKQQIRLDNTDISCKLE